MQKFSIKLNPEIIDKEKSIQLEQNRVLLPSAVVVGTTASTAGNN
jgi:hypothetical protein